MKAQWSSLPILVALLASVGSSWTVYATPEEYYKAMGKRITKYKEAPMLAELVKQGKLPPVEQRLPEEPLGEEQPQERPNETRRGDAVLHSSERHANAVLLQAKVIEIGNGAPASGGGFLVQGVYSG